ncbi:MAG: hypothetical protein QM702_20845 [Rubrivivax sp.]
MILRDHPELPQAAWLRAEVARAWSSRFTRLEPRDDARAQSAWQDGDALDQGRATGVGETAYTRRAAAHATIVVHGDAGRPVVVRLDGTTLAGKAGAGGTTYAVDAPAAEHQIVVYLDGEPVFAQWIALAASTSQARPVIDVRLPEGGGCGETSFAGVTRDESGVRANGITCGRWVAAVPGALRGSVLVARCERDACGPLLEWRTEGLGTPDKPQPSHRGWPAWATWTLVGAFAASATVVTLVATGAFEKRSTEPRFVGGGVKVEAFR